MSNSRHAMDPTFERPATATARTRDPDVEDRQDPSLSRAQIETKRGIWSRMFDRHALIANEGSTARDYLARERNLLSWVKLSCYLAVISAALLLRFQLGPQKKAEPWQRNSEIPLGALFFIASMSSLVLGLSEYFSSDKLMRRRAGFVYTEWPTRLAVACIGALTVTTCVLLLIARE